MGRKSKLKSKERKLKKEEEAATMQMEANQEAARMQVEAANQEAARMQASVLKVEAANQVEDPLSPFPVFQKYDRNGLNITLETKRVGNLDEQTVQWAFELTKSNMKKLYEQSDWGWKEKDKFHEMTEPKAWYLIAKDQEEKPVAFCHFRFDMEMGTEVLYCYEIQLCPEVRKKGLGKFMMQILELMANKYEMMSVMLTVFKFNDYAIVFFKEKLRYTVDGISPEHCIYEGKVDYEILSKLTKSGRDAVALQLAQLSCRKGCC